MSRQRPWSSAGLVCEFVRDASGEIYLLAVLHTEWTSATSVGAANLVGRRKSSLFDP